MIIGQIASYVIGFIVASGIEGAFTTAILQSNVVKDNTFLRVMIILVSVIAIYGVILNLAHLIASFFADE